MANQSATTDMTPVPMADDVKVNTLSSDFQRYPAVTALADGGFVVTWTSMSEVGSSIFGQRYTADGTAHGDAVMHANHYQSYSCMAPLSDGGFVVTWTSFQDGSGAGIYSPLNGFTGIDSFTYKAMSIGAAADSAEALVYVVPVIAGPTTTTLDLVSLSREEQVAATYVSFLGRGADRGGFEFWVDQLTSHETTSNPGDLLAGLSSSFGVSEEAKGLYSFLADPHSASEVQIGSFLDFVYLNLFNRTTDDGGRTYWTNEIKETLAAGKFAGSVLIDIIGGAQNTPAGLDITTLMSKVAVSLEYVHAQQMFNNTWTSEDDRAQGVGLLGPVTSEPQSVLIGVAKAYDIVLADAA